MNKVKKKDVVITHAESTRAYKLKLADDITRLNNKVKRKQAELDRLEQDERVLKSPKKVEPKEEWVEPDWHKMQTRITDNYGNVRYEDTFGYKDTDT